MTKDIVREHDSLCLHREDIKSKVSPIICTYCQLIRKIRAEYEK